MTQLSFNKKSVYSENEINALVKKQKRDISDLKFKWILYELVRDGVLSRIGEKRYIAGLRKYKYELRDISKAIDDFINNAFPDIHYTIWESVQLNEWVNLLFNQNTIFIDVEKEFIDFVVDALINAFGDDYTILVNQSEDTIARYRRNNLIIVKKLFSRSPLDKRGHQIRLEKLMVDLLCEKCYSSMLDSSAIEDVYSGVKQSYAIDTTKMFNYAKRRNTLELTKTLWGDESDQ